MKDEDIPALIPAVSFDKNGEPRIVREVLRKESPIPRGISLLILLLAIATVVYVFTEQRDRDAEFKQQQSTDQMQFDRLDDTIERLDTADERSQRERDALRALVLGVIAANGNEDEVRRVLERFAKDTNNVTRQSPSSAPAASPRSDPETPAAMPTPSRSSSPPMMRPPPPEPTQEPTPEPTPEPSPTLSGPVGVACIDSILGRICV